MVKVSNSKKQQENNERTNSLYVARNISKIQKMAGVDRAAKGVAEAIMQHQVLPVLEWYIWASMQKAQQSGRSTVRQSHGESVYENQISHSYDTLEL